MRRLSHSNSRVETRFAISVAEYDVRTMMKTLITTIIVVGAGCVFASDIELTIEPVTNLLLVSGSSQGVPSPPSDVDITGAFSHPDNGFPCSVSGNNIVHLPERPSPHALAWASNNTARVDFFACIKNTFAKPLSFYDEWNSLGYNRLKLVCYCQEWQEIWISKQPGNWYRNFPSWTTVQPGGLLRIPVAFDELLWSGVDKAKATKGFTGVCVFYDQLDAPATNQFGISSNQWQGCEFSRYYDVGTILPRRGFVPRKKIETDRGSNQVPQVIVAPAPKPEH